MLYWSDCPFFAPDLYLSLFQLPNFFFFFTGNLLVFPDDSGKPRLWQKKNCPATTLSLLRRNSWATFWRIGKRLKMDRWRDTQKRPLFSGETKYLELGSRKEICGSRWRRIDWSYFFVWGSCSNPPLMPLRYTNPFLVLLPYVFAQWKSTYW